jgi:hypothetical protein
VAHVAVAPLTCASVSWPREAQPELRWRFAGEIRE